MGVGRGEGKTSQESGDLVRGMDSSKSLPSPTAHLIRLWAFLQNEIILLISKARGPLAPPGPACRLPSSILGRKSLAKGLPTLQLLPSCGGQRKWGLEACGRSPVPEALPDTEPRLPHEQSSLGQIPDCNIHTHTGAHTHTHIHTQANTQPPPRNSHQSPDVALGPTRPMSVSSFFSPYVMTPCHSIFRRKTKAQRHPWWLR